MRAHSLVFALRGAGPLSEAKASGWHVGERSLQEELATESGSFRDSANDVIAREVVSLNLGDPSLRQPGELA
jgi:hypothetical protein